MPEILTKYPDVALQILKDANIHCGMGVKQKILINCPTDRFCALPTGEICVYGLKDIPIMTQIQPWELILGNWINIALLIFTAILGIIIGRMTVKK